MQEEKDMTKKEACECENEACEEKAEEVVETDDSEEKEVKEVVFDTKGSY